MELGPNCHWPAQQAESHELGRVNSRISTLDLTLLQSEEGALLTNILTPEAPKDGALCMCVGMHVCLSVCLSVCMCVILSLWHFSVMGFCIYMCVITVYKMLVKCSM